MTLSLKTMMLAMLCSFAAAAGGLQRSFHVGAVVVASATVSARLVKVGSQDTVDVRTGGYRAPPPALLVNGQVKLLSGANGADLGLLNDGQSMVTVLY